MCTISKFSFLRKIYQLHTRQDQYIKKGQIYVQYLLGQINALLKGINFCI